MLTKVVPNIFYSDVAVGIDLFVDAIGLSVLHQDEDLVVVGRDRVKLNLVQSAEYAAKDRPELALETDDIEVEYARITVRRPDLLHPNLPRITRREWGAREFALLDATTVCVVFREWPKPEPASA